MEPKAYQYYAYRYLLVEETTQLSIWERPKDQLIPDLCDLLVRERKLTGTRRNRKHLLIFVKNPRSNLYIAKLAKERRFTKLDEGSDDVQPVSDHDYPFVTFVLELKRQLVLIQRRTSVFAEPDSAREAIEELLRTVGNFGRYRLVLTEITPEEQFWDYVESADDVYQLQLILHGPNLFEDLWKGDDIAKKVHEVYGSTETTIGMKNDQGKLKVVKEVFKDIVKVISAGGGRYLLRLRQRGENMIETITSKMNTVVTPVKGEADDLHVDDLEQRLIEVDKLHGDNGTNRGGKKQKKKGN